MKEKTESTENNSLMHGKGLDPQVVSIAWTLRQRSRMSVGHLLGTDTPWTRKSVLWGTLKSALDTLRTLAEQIGGVKRNKRL